MPTRFVGFESKTVASESIPITGQIQIQIQDARDAGYVYISRIEMKAITEAKGETHTHEKNT